MYVTVLVIYPCTNWSLNTLTCIRIHCYFAFVVKYSFCVFYIILDQQFCTQRFRSFSCLLAIYGVRFRFILLDCMNWNIGSNSPVIHYFLLDIDNRTSFLRSLLSHSNGLLVFFRIHRAQSMLRLLYLDRKRHSIRDSYRIHVAYFWDISIIFIFDFRHILSTFKLKSNKLKLKKKPAWILQSVFDHFTLDNCTRI